MQSNEIKKIINKLINDFGEDQVCKRTSLNKNQLEQLKNGINPFETDKYGNEFIMMNEKLAALYVPDDDKRIDDKSDTVWRMWFSQDWVKKQNEVYVVNKLLPWLGTHCGKIWEQINRGEKPDFIILDPSSNEKIGLEVTRVIHNRRKALLAEGIEKAIGQKDSSDKYQNASNYKKMLLIVIIDDDLGLSEEAQQLQTHQFNTNLIDNVYIIKRCCQKDYIAELSINKKNNNYG